ncbi:hypothetical protein DSO57_1003771 [Entomophthora muscae]|uniref:Uncharacterized protein n=1 Tax=Entomophthora muscae TaxID=34485 RepID=A0ACC2TJP2_9FUNG|nr:hypothetical protein DSO57_1003771 [Entomophthora muscae]
MTNRGREFIGGEFVRLLQDWYQPTEGLAPAEVHLYSGDACLVIRKILEEFVLMQAKYKLLTNHSPLLENDNSSKLVPGYNPGHTLGTGAQEPHRSGLEGSWTLRVQIVSVGGEDRMALGGIMTFECWVATEGDCQMVTNTLDELVLEFELD